LNEVFGARQTLGSSVLSAIGWTPLVALSRVTRGLDGRVLAKLDYLNPGGSKKDRIALRMIEDAERSGELRPGQAVVELTSGNTGTGLAIVCAVTGHPFVAVMSAGNSAERAQMMRALGAEVELVDQQEGSRVGHVSGEDLALVEEAAARIAAERGAFRADQFHLDGNPAAHGDGTAREIWEQSGGEVGAFCEFVGTGGTFTGIARYFKKRDPSIGCYVIEPEGAAALSGEPVVRPGHRIQGGGYSMSSLPLLDRDLVDGFLTVTDRDAIDAARRLARTEGILAGFSGGACLAGAEQLLRGPHSGETMVIVLADSGMKYLSTDLWTDDESANVWESSPTLRLATIDEVDAIEALMKASTRDLFPSTYSDEQTRSSVEHIAVADPMLIEDGTYFVIEVGGDLVACGGWSRRDKLYTGSGSGAADARLLDSATESARIRAMFVRSDWTRRGLGTLILEASEAAAKAEGFRTLSLMSTMPGLPLYEKYGFTVTEWVDIPMPDGTTIAGAAMEKPVA